MTERSYTAAKILKWLSARHAEDLFVPECKDGETNGRDRHSRLDAWVLRRSWAHPLAIGYEIKVSRTDFTGDKKWMSYLGMCNELYFVAPKGVIEPGEVPDLCGLLCPLGDSGRFKTVKKAPYRTADRLVDVMRYILICRTRHTVDEMDVARLRAERISGWQKWLDEKRGAKDLGTQISYHVSNVCRKTAEENEQLKSRIEHCKRIEKEFREMGLNPNMYAASIKHQIDRATKEFPARLQQTLTAARDSLSNAIAALTPKQEDHGPATQ